MKIYITITNVIIIKNNVIVVYYTAELINWSRFRYLLKVLSSLTLTFDVTPGRVRGLPAS